MNKINNKDKDHIHRFELVTKSINKEIDYSYEQCKICNMVVYPLRELQKIYDYSKNHQFMFVQDWILSLMYTNTEVPIIGITCFEKMLFLTIYEFAQEQNIPSENPGFKGYKFGPYSERIDDILNGLEDADLIKTEGRRGTKGEYFILTKTGQEMAKKSFDKLTPDQQKKYIELRLDWHQLGFDGLENYIYKKYPEFTKESLVLERVLHRRRMGKLVEEN